MATFPSITPTYGASKTSNPMKRVVQFGDGYQHRLTVGLPAHMNPKAWDLAWNVSETDADTIEAFLDARAEDQASFDWSPLDETDTYKWICQEWTKTIPYNNRATITARFIQVFEP